MKIKLKVSLLAYISTILLFILNSCSKEPEQFLLGTDVCEHCKMTIVDPKWGAEIVMKTGKVIKFDVVECMVLHIEEDKLLEEKISALWTINYLEPGTFIDAKNAAYIRSLEFNSPMGLNAIAIPSRSDAVKIKLNKKPEIISWTELNSIIKQEFLSAD